MPAKLTIQTQELNKKYEKAGSPESRSARPGRSASAASGRQYSQREAPSRRPARSAIDEEGEDAYPDELYDMYSAGGASNSRGSRGGPTRQRQQRYVEDEDGSDYEDGSFDEGDFEMISTNRRGPGSVSSRGASRRPDVRKIRIKVHAADDVRYIMIGAACEYPDLVDRVRDKFELRKRFKVKMKDEEGDMITVGDQDDLEMAVQAAKSQARKQRLDAGKMEVSFPLHVAATTRLMMERC